MAKLRIGGIEMDTNRRKRVEDALSRVGYRYVGMVKDERGEYVKAEVKIDRNLLESRVQRGGEVRGIDGEEYGLFESYPKQGLFLGSDVDEALYGGARGGGKSYTLAADAALHVRRWHRGVDGEVVIDSQSIDYGDYVALILRRRYTDIYMNFKPICDRIYERLGAIWGEKSQCYTFPSGAKIYLKHCNDANDVEKYIGGNYHYLGIEEANQFPERWVREIGGSVRSTNPELKPFKRYTTNPGGIGHVWLKRRFIDVCPPVEGSLRWHEASDVEYVELMPGEPYRDDSGNYRWFVPSLVFDNPALVNGDMQYINFLKSLDPIKKKMWLHGKWDEMSGLFFWMWSKEWHVVDEREVKIDPVNCRIYRCVDYGTTNPFVCLFVQVDRGGNVLVFDEIYETGLTPSMQADMILSRTRQWRLTEDDIDLTVVDPAMKTGTQDMGMRLGSVLEIYQDCGVEHIALGNNARVQGWGVVRDYMKVPDADEIGEQAAPKLRFSSRCTACIETIPALVSDQNNVEDVDTDGEDHCVSGDTLIYTTNGFVPIKDLVGKDGYCYGYNSKEGRIGATKYWGARKTRKNAEVWELKLDDCSSLIATPDHQIMMRDGTYKELKDLCAGDSIMPIYTTIDSHGHLVINQNNGKRRPAQIMVYEDIYEKITDNWKYNVHHIDEDKLNNNPDNLMLMTRAEHCGHHAKKRRNPNAKVRDKLREIMFRKYQNEESRKMNRIYLDAARIKASEWHISEAGKEWHKQHAKKMGFGNTERFNKVCAVCYKEFEGDRKSIYCSLNCKQRAVARKKQGIPVDALFMGYKKQGRTGHKKRMPMWAYLNHKVVSVSYYGNQDTYCMTTEFGNFATDKIIVHNCADALRYLLMFIHVPEVRMVKNNEPKWLQDLRKNRRSGDSGDVAAAWTS